MYDERICTTLPKKHVLLYYPTHMVVVQVTDPGDRFVTKKMWLKMGQNIFGANFLFFSNMDIKLSDMVHCMAMNHMR